MALTRSLILYNGSDALPNVDFTTDTDWPQTEFASMGNLGEAAAGQWLVRDEAGTMPDDSGAKKYIAGHNVLVATVGSNTLWRGRVAAQEQFRGRQKAGRAFELNVTLEDQNSHLRGIIVRNWVRPAELDTTRALALVTDYLNGSPRATTVLGTGKIITSSNTILLPAKTFNGVTPFEVMQELAANTDKEMFVTVDNELAYFGHDYTGYASGLRISDDLADQNATTFAPWDPRGNVTGRQLLSALAVYYGTNVTQASLQVTAPQNLALFDYWEDVFWDNESTTAAQATARAQKQLDYRAQNDVSYSCSIGPMAGERTAEIKAGQSILFKARAARAGRSASGTYLGDSFLSTRVRELRWTMPAEDLYIAHLELERPKRTQPTGQGDQALTQLKQTPVPGSAGGGPTGTFQLTILMTADSILATPYIAAGFLGGGAVQFFADQSTFPPFGVMHWGLRDDLSNTYLGGDFTTGVQHVVTIGVSSTVAFGRVGSDSASAPIGVWGLATGLFVGNNPTPNTAANQIRVTNVASLTTTIDDFTRVVASGWGTATNGSAWGTYSGTPVSSVDGSTGLLRGSGGSLLLLAITDNALGGSTVAYYGYEYGPVHVAWGDGVTTSFTLPYPTSYVTGTLDVRVDGVSQPITELSPTAGTFSLAWAPTDGDITARWTVPRGS